MNNYIFGGTNVISGTAHDFTQIGSITIAKNDMEGLTAALRNLGVQEEDVIDLKSALQQDAVETTTPSSWTADVSMFTTYWF